MEKSAATRTREASLEIELEIRSVRSVGAWWVDILNLFLFFDVTNEIGREKRPSHPPCEALN